LVTLPYIIPLSFKNVAGKMVMNVELELNRDQGASPRNVDDDEAVSPVAQDDTVMEETPHHPVTAVPYPSNARRSDNSAVQETQHFSNEAMPSASDIKSLHNVMPSASMTPSITNISYHQYPQLHQYTSTPRHSSRFNSQQSVQQSQPVGGQKPQPQPGTILHTADPEIFALNTVHSVPSEDNLIKKGGNGMVFGVTYYRREYAVKKTPYRSKEFHIHKKLKHANIIELSCFMFGAPQPQHRRRFYCYHFMPRVTGDLARMVTDRRDLVMTSLITKYQNDPLQLGSIQGNWKYILKELLKGLGYMHSLNVVHRDIKASNVLINMYCSCSNPLTCSCSQKCSVKIADFDAALQLDSLGNLPVTSPSNQQYLLVPVGTDGYRSPELSQHTISNSLSVVTPALGVKTDIWSVGLLLVRILNGSIGPASQYKVSCIHGDIVVP
jgi:hypothetical protein